MVVREDLSQDNSFTQQASRDRYIALYRDRDAGASELLARLLPVLADAVTAGEGTTMNVARVICDINLPDGSPFPGDPRAVLKRQIARAAQMGFVMNAGMEAEFFLFKPGSGGEATTTTHDVGSYFDLAPADLKKVMDAIIADPGASLALRRHVARRYPVLTGGSARST